MVLLDSASRSNVCDSSSGRGVRTVLSSQEEKCRRFQLCAIHSGGGSQNSQRSTGYYPSGCHVLPESGGPQTIPDGQQQRRWQRHGQRRGLLFAVRVQRAGMPGGHRKARPPGRHHRGAGSARGQRDHPGGPTAGRRHRPLQSVQSTDHSHPSVDPGLPALATRHRLVGPNRHRKRRRNHSAARIRHLHQGHQKHPVAKKAIGGPPRNYLSRLNGATAIDELRFKIQAQTTPTINPLESWKCRDKRFILQSTGTRAVSLLTRQNR